MADVELWTVTFQDRIIRCTTRPIYGPALHVADALFGIELRIERNHEMYLTELYRDRAKLSARSEELHALLIVKGWQPAT